MKKMPLCEIDLDFYVVFCYIEEYDPCGVVDSGLTIRGSLSRCPRLPCLLEEVMIVMPPSIDACIRMPDRGIGFRGNRI